ncbi:MULTISPECIES: helix-turn-helix domain-containing protein [Methylobacterium]|uniref:AraC-like ligand-binding domain-containing protein n=1 Tax=Methylobacterium TaxID=407 RepID=UPI0013EC9669|nr:helix-turn-helix domain-containing protein [Methylobacterium sp. DB0501]NGM35878.1 AraC family transcriptional regulator [Methylobacterium sp. DB0501]
MDDALSHARPLSRFARVATRDADEAREGVGRIFCPHRLVPVGPGAASLFDARHHAVAFGDLTLNYVAYGARVEIDPGCLERFALLQIPLAGHALVENGGRRTRAGAGRATLLSPALPTRMVWEAGCEKLILRVPRDLLEEHLARILDRVPRALAFDPAIDLERPRGAAIAAQARLLLHLAEARERPDAASGPHEHELSSALVALLVGHMLERGEAREAPAPRVSVAPAHVRRAEDYIRAHLDAALTLPCLAARAGSSVRSLQEGFRHFRGGTISGFILAQRLDRWRELILGAGPEAKVGDLAFSVGLNHLGRAAASYRDRFGETPSQTLRRRRP